MGYAAIPTPYHRGMRRSLHTDETALGVFDQVVRGPAEMYPRYAEHAVRVRGLGVIQRSIIDGPTPIVDGHGFSTPSGVVPIIVTPTGTSLATSTPPANGSAAGTVAPNTPNPAAQQPTWWNQNQPITYSAAGSGAAAQASGAQTARQAAQAAKIQAAVQAALAAQQTAGTSTSNATTTPTTTIVSASPSSTAAAATALAGTWGPQENFAVGAQYVDAAGNTLQVVQAGISGSIAPIAPAVLNTSIGDGSVVWQVVAIGGSASGNWFSELETWLGESTLITGVQNYWILGGTLGVLLLIYGKSGKR